VDALRDRMPRPLSAADLANIPDFRLGEVTVSPSRRLISGAGNSVELQPRVMQVLAVLAEHLGQVVSRDALFERCWGGVYVGDDSLNRVIAALRKLAAEVGSGFEIETIARTGYRLAASDSAVTARSSAISFNRRNFVGGASALAALAGVGAWASWKSRDDQLFEQFLREGDIALIGDDNFFRPEVALRSYRAAVRIQPNSAGALGRLALAQSYFSQVADPQHSAEAAANTSKTMQQALAIDPREPNALMAMFELQGSAWTVGLAIASSERSLRSIPDTGWRSESYPRFFNQPV